MVGAVGSRQGVLTRTTSTYSVSDGSFLALRTTQSIRTTGRACGGNAVWRMTLVRAIFFEEHDAAAVVARLRADGFEASVERERLAGEDDDEGHPWAVTSDAPAFMLEVLVDAYDGWLDESVPEPSMLPPLDLPTAPRRIKRPDLG